jgi:hypothetical protein
MFVVKIVSDLQQVIDVFTTNINDLLQVTDNFNHKHQYPAASH